MTRRAKMSTLAVPILMAVAMGGAVVLPAGAVSSVKKFSETLHVGAVGPVMSATLAPGVAQTLQFDLKNDLSSNQAFGSAQILVPTGFQADTPAVVTGSPSNFHFAANAAHTGFLLTSTGPTGSGLAPGKTISMTLSVTPPTTGACNVVWPTEVKQSNDFSGTGNNFVALNTVTTTVGSNHLVFTAQPTETEFDKTMTPAVEVTAEDPCGNAVSAFAGTVTLTDAFTPTKLAGGTTATAVSGVATFNAITLVNNDWGYDDSLTASATGFTSVTSNTFSVDQLLTTCAASAPCNTAVLTNAGAPNTTATINAASAPTADKLRVSVAGDPNSQAFVQTCRTSVPAGTTTPIFYGTVVSLQVNNRQKTVTMVLPKSYVLLQPTPNGTPFWDICLQSDAPFTDKYGHSNVTAGFLPDCPPVLPSPVQPCVQSRNKNAGNEIMKFVLPPGDPHAAWG
jgi:hypothetical protein